LDHELIQRRALKLRRVLQFIANFCRRLGFLEAGASFPPSYQIQYRFATFIVPEFARLA
jgi:hypothetical protein